MTILYQVSSYYTALLGPTVPLCDTCDSKTHRVEAIVSQLSSYYTALWGSNSVTDGTVVDTYSNIMQDKDPIRLSLFVANDLLSPAPVAI